MANSIVTAFLGGFGFAGLFTKLKLPGTPLSSLPMKIPSVSVRISLSRC
jgi:hypothetical protein